MNSISSSIELPLLRSHSRPNQRQRLQNSPSQSSPNLHHIFRQIYFSPQTIHRFPSLKAANAIPSTSCSLILATSTIPPSQSGDVSVLLQTGGVLLIVYLIANFIVPEFIMKSYRSDESEGKGSVKDEERGANGGRKKQGFGGNNKR